VFHEGPWGVFLSSRLTIQLLLEIMLDAVPLNMMGSSFQTRAYSGDQNIMRILFIGDVFGRPGRQAVRNWLPGYRIDQGIDFVIANGENAAGGKGLTRGTSSELFSAGIDALTGGNHSFQHRDAYPLYDEDSRLIRPFNLPPGVPGRGYGVFDSDQGPVAVLNLLGRAFMKDVDCPFRAADEAIPLLQNQAAIIIVDFHAEATSEKQAMLYHLNGRVSAIIGTHTHIPTADARVSDRGTGFISDVGMTGPYASVIGVEPDIVLEQMLTGLPVKYRVAEGDVRISALLIDLDADSGQCVAVSLIQEPDWCRTG
jgi:metallophosphoesterase (TIGR00282 family)